MPSGFNQMSTSKKPVGDTDAEKLRRRKRRERGAAGEVIITA